MIPTLQKILRCPNAGDKTENSFFEVY